MLDKTLKLLEICGFSRSPSVRCKSSSQNGLPGALWAAQGSRRDAQDGAKRRQERPTTVPRGAGRGPRASQRRFRSGLGGRLGPTWRPRGPRRPPGAPIYEAPQENNRQKERTCKKVCNARKLKPCLFHFSAFYTKPLAVFRFHGSVHDALRFFFAPAGRAFRSRAGAVLARRWSTGPANCFEPPGAFQA